MGCNGRTTSEVARGLLFDMDGLLLDTERLFLDAFVEMAEGLGLPEAEAFGLSMVGLSGALCQPRLRAYLPQEVALDAFRTGWDRGFAARVAGGIPLKPGVGRCLAALSAAGHAMVVVTSTRTEAARRHLGRAGLLDHFRDVVGADCVAAHKPDPAPYLMGAARAGHAPEACDAFEDSDAGVAAAVAAGCRVHQVPDMRPPGRPLPDLGQSVAGDLAGALAAAGLL